MIYLVNPGGRPKRRRARPARKRGAKKTTRKGGTVAAKKRRRRTVRRRTAAAPVRRRRRRRSVVARARSSAPVKRRRRRSAVARKVSRRRRYSRNPSFSIRGVMGVAMEGGIIVAGQWGTARIAELVSGKLIPASLSTRSPLAATAVANVVAAVGTSLIARKAAPRYARLLSAAAWAQAITSTLSATQVGARLLSGNFAAPVAAASAASATAGYARRNLNGYGRSGYNVTAGRGDGMDGYSASGRGINVGSF